MMKLSVRAENVLFKLGWQPAESTKAEFWKALVSASKKEGPSYFSDDYETWSDERHAERALSRQFGCGVVTRNELFKWFGKERPTREHVCVCVTCGRRMS